MITRSKDFDLGRDKERMKDPNDAARQLRTVEVILERFFHSRTGQRFEIQILADGRQLIGHATLAVILIVHFAAIRPDLLDDKVG